MERTLEELLRDTRELIDRSWGQGADYDSLWQSFCTRGAIRHAYGRSNNYVAYKEVKQEMMYRAVVKQLPLKWRFFPTHTSDEQRIIRWNDFYWRKKEQVLLVLDKAIAAEVKRNPPDANLPGPSRTITVEPIETPVVAPEPVPSEPEKQPEKDPEKVPA